MSQNTLWPTNRRTFLRSLSVAGAAVAAPLTWTATAHAKTGENARIGNRFFEVQFEGASGVLQIRGKDRTALIKNGVVRALTSAGVRSTTESDYRRTVEIRRIQDALGSGEQLQATCTDARRMLDIAVLVTLYDDRNAVVIEAFCRNASGTDALNVASVEPLRASSEVDGCCHWPGATKLLTNGRMYYDPGKVLELAAKKDLESWFNICLYTDDRRPGLVAGYLENNSSLGHIAVRRERGAARADNFSLAAESRYQSGFVLKPGASISSDRVMLCAAADPFTALENYAQCIADVHAVRLNPVANGWCSWFCSFESVTEEEVLRNARHAARHLKPYGMDCIQVDDGFYRAFGDWEGNEKFPHGMKWLAGQIRELGLTPGIWFAPYVISEGTDIHRNHPEWLIRKANGDLRPVRPGTENEDDGDTGGRRRYALDISHPGAAEWLGNLFDTAANDWGYDFIKIDFVDWSLLAAERYYDPTATRASLYRKGVEIMRRAMGPNRHLLDCGPGQVSAGFIDSMRIELDQPPVTWNQYFLNSASSAPAAAKRYYFHNRVWINDADHIVLAPLTIPQAQAAATLIALSGGTTFSGDRLTDLDAVRLDILRKVLPAYGEAARPIDLFDHDLHELFALNVKKPFAEWTVLAAFNIDLETPAKKTIALERLGLDPAKTYLAYNFWEQRFLGGVRKEITLNLPPSSGTLLAIHEKRDEPQFLSTDRHVMQGAIELEAAAWDASSGAFSGISLGPKGTEHNVFIHLPHEHEWVQKEPFFFHDREGITLKMMEPHILRVQARFENSKRVAWNASLRDLFPDTY